MAAANQRKPKIKDLGLSSDQLKLAKKFASSIGIGTSDDLHYFAVLWYRNNVKSNGDVLSATKQKRFVKELERRSKSKQYLGPVTKEILGKITLLSLQEQTDKDLLSQTAPETAGQVRSTTTRVTRRTQPTRPERPKVTITIDKNEVEKGGSYTVIWKSENANFVSRSTQFDPPLQDIELSGSRTITANRVGSKTFSITVRSLTGASASARATINIVAVRDTSQQSQQQPSGQQQTTQTRRPRTTTTRVTRSSLRNSDSQLLNSINRSLKNIVDILENQAGIIRAVERGRRREAENQRRRKREGILEMAKGAGGLLVEKALTPIKSIFEKIWRFIFFTLLGRVFTEFLNWFNDPKNKDKVKTLSRFIKDNFWLLIGGAALYFLTPFGGFINSLLGKLAWYTTKLIASKVLLNPKFLVIAGTIAALIGLANLYNQLPGQKEAVKSFVERGSRVKSGKSVDIPGLDTMEEQYKTPMGGRTTPGLLEGVASGGFITDKTGMRVRGAGTDTQLTALTPGEIVMNRSAVEAVGAGNLLALNKMYGGPNANNPKKLGNIFGMSGGGMVGNKNSKANFNLINPQARTIFQRLVDSGLTRTAAAGVVANIGVETGYTYDPNTHQLRNGPGRGLVQWEKGGRFDTDPINLSSFSKSRKRPWNDLNNQVDFIMHELNTHPEYQLVKEKLNNAKSVEQATNIFLREYEKAGVPHTENRLQVGQQIVKAGWLKPPKPNPKPQSPQGFRLPNLGSLIPNFSNPAAATPRPNNPPVNPRQKPKIGGSQQGRGTGRSRIRGKKKGGSVDSGLHITSNMLSLPGLTEDKFPILAQQGEYVVPKLTVQKIGLQFFNDLAAATDSNSEAAKLSPIPRREELLPPMSASPNMAQIMTLPPIMNGSGMAPQSTPATSSQIPSFSAVSPQASNTRSYLSEIYSIA